MVHLSALDDISALGVMPNKRAISFPEYFAGPGFWFEQWPDNLVMKMQSNLS
jgi:hypothetical protein